MQVPCCFTPGPELQAGAGQGLQTPSTSGLSRVPVLSHYATRWCFRGSSSVPQNVALQGLDGLGEEDLAV